MKPLVPILLTLGSLVACTIAPNPPAGAPQTIEPLPGNLAPPVAPRDSTARAASKAYYLGPRGEEWF